MTKPQAQSARRAESYLTMADHASGPDAGAPPEADAKPQTMQVEPKPPVAANQAAGGGLLEAASTVAIFAMFVYCWYGCPQMPGYVAPDQSPATTANDITRHATNGGVVTPEELAKHTTVETGIWLSIFGHVFDVSEGAQFYGPGKGYGVFAGRDASKAYVTGEFKGEGLTDDVSELTPEQMLEVRRWQKFYHDHAKYTYRGKLHGRFYDENGRGTPALEAAQVKLAKGDADRNAAEAAKKKYPSCNMKWTQEHGGSLWCEDATKVPRKMRQGETQRCACFSLQEAAAAVADPALDLELYDGCDAQATKCHTP